MLLAVNTTLRLLLLRDLMRDTSVIGPSIISAYIVPLNDAHQGTRVPACAARLRYISGFTGSSGVAVITQTNALLWTDGRYFTQAMDELDNNWTLMRQGLHDTPTIEKYLAKSLKPGDHIGVDPSLFSITAWNAMQTNLRSAELKLTPVHSNLIDRVWAKDEENKRPSCPDERIQQINETFTGKSTRDKLSELRNLMIEREIVGIVLVQLDDIAWLLNLRGFDIPSAALFLSFVIVKREGFELFVDSSKIDSEIRDAITKDGGVIYAYDQVTERLKKLEETTTGKILLDKTSSYSLVSLVPQDRQILELSPVIAKKAVKNEIEIQGIKNALVRDAAFLARFYSWVEKEVHSGKNLTELSASDKLMSIRKESDMFLTTSFTTIAGVDSNGAIIHYRPTTQTDKRITPFSMFLVDAGATYMDGTTDITRTFHFGVPSDHQRECYTRVLKGQIAVATSIFPMFIRGNRLDSFARKFLWEVGLDYGHGTGHGIGINVHEGPSKISYDNSLAPDDKGLRENMLTSNEPGYYEEGSFGIRLENIVRIVNSTITGKGGQPFLAIEDLTFLPYQHNLIKKSLLTTKEIDYLNKYQEKCRDIVGKFIKDNYPDAYDWIIKETQPL